MNNGSLARLPGRMPALLCALVALPLLGIPQAMSADPPTLVDQGQRAFQRGAFSQAVSDWEAAADGFRRQGNEEASVSTSISLAAAYQAIGHQRRAVEILEQALPLARSSGNRTLTARVQGRLGAALVVIRDLDPAASLLHEALETARKDQAPDLEAEVLNDLGNLLLTRQKPAEALTAYQDSAKLARQTGNRTLAAQALCNAATAAARAGDVPQADALNAQALEETAQIDASHAKAFLLLTAGQTDQRLQPTSPEPDQRLLLRAHRSYDQALALAETLGDLPLQSYALGYLAQLYERDAQPDAALRLTRRAAFAAQQAQSQEILYRWEWQTGRLLHARGNPEAAIEAYRRAVQTLEPIRNDVALGYSNASRTPSFREEQGPLFLELSELLLQQAETANDPDRVQDLLREARDTVEHLKAVELEDYFCDDCVNVQQAKTRDIETVDGHTAVVYLIPLPTRTVVLVGLTSGLQQFTLGVNEQSLMAEVNRLRRNLETRTTYGYLEQAQNLYDWLIRPILDHLRTHHIDTLVFVPDGALRTIPLASLHDGEQFLIQEFAVAVTPGLALVEPKPIQRGEVRLLLGGLSEPVQGFPPLDFVTGELDDLEQLYPSDRMLNAGFTLEELKRTMTEEQYSIIHIASHGQFDRDIRNTFVLTYDDKLTLNALEALIRPSQYRGRPVELLVLSACQTAAGDDRAALGLAGVAVKAGARSALATLWFVNDQSTSTLVSEVYRQLRNSPSISKARALQVAQVKLLSDRRYRHPCYWSPFLIIGNWL